MLLKRIRKKINNNQNNKDFILKAKEYYKNNTDIVCEGITSNYKQEKDPLRNADNRIVHNFHELLVDEKISYMFSYPVQFEVDNNIEITNKISDILGDDYERKIKNIGIEASNAGRAWIHYWIDETDGLKNFKYAKVDSEQIIAEYSNGLERELESIIRYYNCYELEEGLEDETLFSYVEYWTKDKFIRMKFKETISSNYISCEEVTHMLEAVPFIEFANNEKKQSDLVKYKKLIDLYDRVASGFANDLEDIQQVIYILENYSGENLGQFLGDLKRYKAIKTETGDGGGGIKTLQIEIPVEARKVLLELLKKQIYESGQGLQQDSQSYGNASGVALDFFYRELEIKSGLLETEFKSSLKAFIRVILKFLNIDAKKINLTFTRNKIRNDLETAQIAQQSVGVISKKTILKNHPWVEDLEEELTLTEEETKVEDDYNFEDINE